MKALNPDFINENPELAHLAALRGSFGAPQRLRELKGPALDLPPLYAQEEKAVRRLEALDSRFLENLRKSGDAAPAEDRSRHARELDEQKSRARIEKLKDVKSSLELANQRLEGLQPGTSQTLVQLRSLLLSAQSQLTATYAAAAPSAEIMDVARPFLARLTAKLDCAQAHTGSAFAALRQTDAELIKALQAPNALPVLEKAALLELGQLVDRAIERFLKLTGGEQAATRAAEAEQLQQRQHQPSLELLQRAGRSHEEMLRQLQAFHGRLGQPQQRMSLRLLKGTLQQLRNRALRDLQVFQDVVNLHLPALAPILPLLRRQHDRLSLACTADFLARRSAHAQDIQVPDTPGLPESHRPLLASYALLTDKVVVALEALTAQTLEKEKEVEIEGELEDLDAMLANWQ